jgi:uncharacterized protein YndB with AHSA1/START domain
MAALPIQVKSLRLKSRLVLKWRNEFRPELREEGYSRCTMEIDQAGEVVKLTITHEIDKQGSRFIEAVSGGWPKLLSNLKTLLETGTALPMSMQCREAESCATS